MVGSRCASALGRRAGSHGCAVCRRGAAAMVSRGGGTLRHVVAVARAVWRDRVEPGCVEACRAGSKGIGGLPLAVDDGAGPGLLEGNGAKPLDFQHATLLLLLRRRGRRHRLRALQHTGCAGPSSARQRGGPRRAADKRGRAHLVRLRAFGTSRARECLRQRSRRSRRRESMPGHGGHPLVQRGLWRGVLPWRGHAAVLQRRRDRLPLALALGTGGRRGTGGAAALLARDDRRAWPRRRFCAGLWVAARLLAHPDGGPFDFRSGSRNPSVGKRTREERMEQGDILQNHQHRRP